MRALIAGLLSFYGILSVVVGLLAVTGPHRLKWVDFLPLAAGALCMWTAYQVMQSGFKRR